MKKVGPLTLNNNVPELDGMPLAIYVAGDPVKGAADILQSIGIGPGEGVWVKGTRGQLAGRTVLYVSQVSKFFIAEAGSFLGGDPQPDPVDFKCKQCGYDNKGLPYIDVNHPPGCGNPAPPTHVLKIF